jgi:hypothetical protein
MCAIDAGGTSFQVVPKGAGFGPGLPPSADPVIPHTAMNFLPAHRSMAAVIIPVSFPP